MPKGSISATQQVYARIDEQLLGQGHPEMEKTSFQSKITNNSAYDKTQKMV